MPPKRQRMNRAEFTRFFASGARYHSPNFQLVHTPGDRYKVAVVVGKKVYKSAVRRNRLRRQVYGIITRFHQQHPQTGSFIIIAKPGAGAVTRKQLPAEVEPLLGQVK